MLCPSQSLRSGDHHELLCTHTLICAMTRFPTSDRLRQVVRRVVWRVVPWLIQRPVWDPLPFLEELEEDNNGGDKEE